MFSLVVLGTTIKKAGHQKESEQMFQAALSAAKSIEDEIDQRTTLGAIVTDFAEQGLALEAEQFAQVIQEPLERAGTLQQVAISFALSNQKADAQRLFQEVEALAEVLKDYRHEDIALPRREGVLTGLSRALAQIGYFAEAERVAWAINDKDCRQQSEALATLSKALAQKHHFEEAERIARSISTDNRQRIDALSILAVALARVGQETTSAALLAEAQQLALTIESPDRKPWALLTIATVFIQLGQWTKAEDTISTIEDKQCLGLAWQELATASQNPNYIAQAKQVAETDLINFQQVGMFQDLAKLMLQLDQPAEAEEFFAAAEQAVDRDVSQYQASLRKDLAISHARLGRFSSAKKIIDRIDRWTERDRALTAVARELSQVGQFSEAKHLIWAIQDDKEQRLALGSLALALMRQHRFAEALDTLDTQTPDDFIRILAIATASLEQLEVGLSSPVLSHILHIIGWVRPDWQKIATILSPLTSLAPSMTR
ncbi:tetratricopeptide repeat protein [Phormidium tenue]|uniref:MalT-like TPR region domain-containing protein n=1 Tax=Phormidium tenue NIES-30 TaxID=549789 RepID=A0A1U7IZ89_9CYAN|nr:hypothetical protein [Phormidium tenue]MBD2234611.1 hypothetical protein [Phormidium tenue FACHB-1052]OKH44201.1 hypothetical protein NIES30_23160 [Phormidium tenue NIES-30]